MKRDIEQIWLREKLSYLDKKFPNLDYFGPEMNSDAGGRPWKGHIDYDTREIVLKVKLGVGWRTFRAPYDGMCRMCRTKPTQGKAETADSE